MCDPQFPVPVTKHFRAKIVVFNVEVPIIKGTTCVLHYGAVQVIQDKNLAKFLLLCFKHCLLDSSDHEKASCSHQ